MERTDEDEATVDEARARLRRDGLTPLTPDRRIAPLLDPEERVLASHAALLERREPPPRAALAPGLTGELYVTSTRLVLVGRPTVSLGLGTIEDVVVAGDRLLVVLRDGLGVAVKVAQPRLLAMQIAWARSAARSAQPSEPADALAAPR